MRKSLLVNGADSRGAWSHSMNIRTRILPSLRVLSKLSTGNNDYASEYFIAKNYDLIFYSGHVQLEYQTGSKFRGTLDWELRNESNQSDIEEILSNRIESSLIRQFPGKGQIEFSLQHIWVRFDGESGTPAAYVMLKGFQPGHNGVGRINARYRISKNLQMDLMYEARLSEGRKAIHNGQIQVRAIF